MDWLWGAELQTKRPGRKVIVAGSAMGIGLGSVEELCKSGFSVIACDINEDGLSKSFSSTNNTRPQWPSPGSVLPVVADVAKPEEMLEKVKHCNGNTLDDIWGYAAIAGIGFYAPTLLLSIDSIKKAFDGTIRALQILEPILIKNHGRVLIMSSLASRLSDSWNCCYNMSKASLSALSNNLRRELGMFGVHVAYMELSVVDTPSFHNTTAEKSIEKYKETVYYPNMLAHLKSVQAHYSLALSPTVVGKEVAHAFASESPHYIYLVAPFFIKLLLPILLLLPITWLESLLSL